MPTIRDLMPSFIAAVAEETRAVARTKAVRAVIDRLARAEHAATGSDRWKAPGYGDSAVRLDGTTAGPTVTVTDPAAFADYLAQRQPGLVTATITVPADRLADALTALEFADVPVVRSEVAPARDADVWINGCCRPFPDVDDETGQTWVVQHVEEGEITGTVTVVTPVVPGLTAERKKPKLVVTLDRKIKAQIEADAIAATETELAALDEPTPAPAEEAVLAATSVDPASAAVGYDGSLDEEPTPAAVVALDRRRAKRGA